MPDLFDQLTSDGPQEDRFPRKRKSAWPQQTRTRPLRNNSPASRPSQQKPLEVSENVWGLAEQFLEIGKAFFGRHIPVNRAEFSKRLSETINSDPSVHRLLRPLVWNDDHTRLIRSRLPEPELTKRLDRINDIVAEMIVLFWSRLEAGATNSGGLQFRFLDDDWDQLWYDAVTGLYVRKLVDGLETGETQRVPANYRQVSEESREAHRMQRLQIRLRRQQDPQDRDPITDEQRTSFQNWVSERKRTS